MFSRKELVICNRLRIEKTYAKIESTHFGIILKTHISIKMTKIKFPVDCAMNHLPPQ